MDLDTRASLSAIRLHTGIRAGDFGLVSIGFGIGAAVIGLAFGFGIASVAVVAVVAVVAFGLALGFGINGVVIGAGRAVVVVAAVVAAAVAVAVVIVVVIVVAVAVGWALVAFFVVCSVFAVVGVCVFVCVFVGIIFRPGCDRDRFDLNAPDHVFWMQVEAAISSVSSVYLHALCIRKWCSSLLVVIKHHVWRMHN